ncbi:MAG: nuclear transport factor 2 family protein [Gemmatimonadaceae bacterium]
MRRASTVLVLLIVVTTPLFSQASRGAPKQPQSATTQTASRLPATSPVPVVLEDQWTSALVRRDTRTFERLLAPNFVYTEDASVMTRRDVINSVSGPDRVDWARNEGMNVHNFGDVQVITGILHTRGRAKTGAFDRRYRFTDTWQRRNGRWQIIAAQDYLIPK